MRVYVECRLTGACERVVLGMGDVIGRSKQAALCINDPRISEAHALVSLRGSSLMLLALRGRFRHKGEVVPEVELKAGVDIELYKGLWLHCEEVVVPNTLTGLEVPGLGVVTLTHTCSLFLDRVTESFSIKQGYIKQADVVMWSCGAAWSYRLNGEEPKALSAGSVFEVGGLTLTHVQIDLEVAGISRTRGSGRPPVLLEVAPTSVSVRVDVHERAEVITGIPGKILAACTHYRHPIEWETLARRVWSDDMCSAGSLRRRFDVGLLRLREKLQTLGLPSDLVGMDGSGLVVLRLGADDRVLYV